MSEIKIKEIREKFGLTQAALAQMMGVSIQTIKNWESGKVIPSTSQSKIRELFKMDDNTIASNIGGDNNQNSGAVIEALARQLEVKDKQIARMQEQIDKLISKIK